MSEMLERIKAMDSSEQMKLMEFLWVTMTNSAEPDAPEWHRQVLESRRRRVERGEAEFMSVEESKRRLREAVHAC